MKSDKNGIEREREKSALPRKRWVELEETDLANVAETGMRECIALSEAKFNESSLLLLPLFLALFCLNVQRPEARKRTVWIQLIFRPHYNVNSISRGHQMRYSFSRGVKRATKATAHIDDPPCSLLFAIDALVSSGTEREKNGGVYFPKTGAHWHCRSASEKLDYPFSLFGRLPETEKEEKNLASRFNVSYTFVDLINHDRLSLPPSLESESRNYRCVAPQVGGQHIDR